MDWQAKWIWCEGEPSPSNFCWSVRKRFDVAPGRSLTDLHITADSRYSVWVNGRYVGHGPVRGFPNRWRYDTYDISSYVQPGANMVAVLVQHYGEGNFQYVAERAGLLAQIECDGAVVAATDSTWLGLPHPSYSRRTPRLACQQAWSEQFDARVEPLGWTLHEFDDAAWTPAKEIGETGCEPWVEILPRDIPFLTQEPTYPVRLMGARLVRTPKQVWAMALKPNLAPGDHTANRIDLQGLIATVIRCSEPMKVSIVSPHHWLGSWRVDGAKVAREAAGEGIELEAGEHLFVVDIMGVNYHAWYPTLVFDSGRGEITLRSPLGEDRPYPFVTAGPFSSPEDPDYLRTVSAASSEQFVADPTVQPIQLKDSAAHDVLALTALAHTFPGDPVIADPYAMLAANEEVTTVSAASGGDTEIMMDFGRELVGFLEIELDAPEGAIIDFSGFENIQDGDIQWTWGINNSFRYTARDGWQRWRSVVRRGFRYATLTVRFPEGCTEPVRLRSIKCYLNTYPYTEQGQFKCSDALLNDVWEISRHTVRLCSEDTFVDCPAYEQAFWVGDSRNESLFAYTAFGDYALARRCLLLAGESLHRSPLVESQVPSGWRNILPAWSLLWAIACEEHYRFTADRSFLDEVYPAIRRQNFNIRERFMNADGLFEIEAWNMLDWADMDTPNSGVVTHQNMWHVEALRRSAKIARTLGETDDEATYLEWAQALKDAVNAHLWSEERQAYIDSTHSDGVRSSITSQQTQTVAYLCDIAPTEKHELFERYLTDVPEGWTTVGSPFMMAFTIEALEKAGDRSRILNLIRKWWGLMLDNDATTCWETYTPHASRWHTRSYCHAWSAAPAYALPSYVLGVQPLEPGFSRFEIRPFLGDLDWARGVFPTPYGDIHVEVKREGETTSLVFTVPEGATAVVSGEEYTEGRYEAPSAG